jgi:3'-phosphoadenosine 5'-phosphosulfate (PAPS) 3'-phosphatase
MDLVDLNSLKQTIISAGDIAKRLRSLQITIDESDKTNITTNVDLEVNNFLENELHRILPVPIISEETYKEISAPKFDLYWLIDPIDGTLSFLNGFDGYVTQAAIICEGKPIASVVYAPEFNDVYSAEFGKGAYKNEKLIKVSTNSQPQTIIDNYSEPNSFVKKIMKHFGITSYIESGSLGLKICRVAEGKADIFVKETRVHDWDIAPGALILEEAGGYIAKLTGETYRFDCEMKKANLLCANRRYILDEAI